jgi:hypothetical protein
MLLVGATLALVAFDLSLLTVATAAGAFALIVFVAVYISYPRLQTPRSAVYGLIIAELSPISLQANFLTAFAYQALCALLLTALIAPLPRLSKLGTYAKPSLLTLAVVGASLVPGVALVLTNSATGVQAAAVSGAMVLLAVGGLLYRMHVDTRAQSVQEA